MVETTIDIRFSGADEDCAVASNVHEETEQQAELVAFAHYAARGISLLGPARAGALINALTAADTKAQPPARGDVTAVFRAVARFIDGATGPRMYFRLRSSEPSHASRSVLVLLDALVSRRDGDDAYRRRLELTSGLLGRLGATGQIHAEGEFDAALAAADIGWRLAGEPAPANGLDLQCPACGNADSKAGFELRVWPSEASGIRKCTRCGAGIWKRGTHRPRLLREDIWSAMESLRSELRAVALPEATVDGGGRVLMDELKRVFSENGWPYAEVLGAPVLLAELSGPAGHWSFYAQAVEEKDLILLYSICPRRVPEQRRLEVANFLTRANYGLAAGNFELDFDDGEVRYKTVLHLQGEELDALTVKRLVRANGIAMETYLPGIGSLIDGTPE